MAMNDNAQPSPDEPEEARITREILELGAAEPLSPDEARRLLRRILEVIQERGTFPETPQDDWVEGLVKRR